MYYDNTRLPTSLLLDEHNKKDREEKNELETALGTASAHISVSYQQLAGGVRRTKILFVLCMYGSEAEESELGMSDEWKSGWLFSIVSLQEQFELISSTT